jgi:GcrA cell cycle regulator
MSEWNDETIESLRQMWDEGLSTAEIGRRLGFTKNAIVGKSHRLKLTPRSSPIPATGGSNGKPRVVRRKARGAEELAQARARTKSVVELRQQPPAPPPPTKPTVTPGTAKFGRTISCCWPCGEPGKPGFHWCGAPAMTGRPYCEEHCALAYVPVRMKEAA